MIRLGCVVEPEGMIQLVVTDDYLNPSLAEFNRQAHDTGRPWFLAKPTGTELWMGPMFQPKHSACWLCLAERLDGHRKIESYLANKLKLNAPPLLPQRHTSASLNAAFGMIALKFAEWAMKGRQGGTMKDRVFSLNLLTLESKHHQVVKRPQCRVCGDPTWVARNQQKPLVLESCDAHREESGYRVFPSESTATRLIRSMSPITGVVSKLRSVDLEINSELKSPAWVYATDHNFAFLDESLDFLRETLRGDSGGKGETEVAAKASAIGEAIERYSGVFQGDEALVRGRFRELEGAIHPNDLMLFSERQYAEREAWNLNVSRFNAVPEPFDETQETQWCPLWSLMDGQQRYLPAALCYFGYVRAFGERFGRADSNGCAAGNTLAEAILQGFFELVERDSVALWWYNKLTKPAVDLDSFESDYFSKLRAWYAEQNRELWVLDITSDLGVPSFAAVSRRTDKLREDIIYGFGTHFDARLALSRALTEVNQFLAPAMNIKSDLPQHYPKMQKDVLDWWQKAGLHNQRQLRPAPDQAPRVAADFANSEPGDLCDHVAHCVALVRERGMDLLVLDQSRPDLELKVVRVVVPGLRHFWARFREGRLYDVPVTSGELRRPTPEHQLNPFPVII